MLENKDRIYYFDNLKFILIVLVVIGHFIDYNIDKSNNFKSLFVFIYTFHMPLFIFVSGLFHSGKRIKEKFLFFVTVGILLKIVLFLGRFILFKSTSFSLLNLPDLPWFMFALAIYFAVSKFLKDIDKKYLLFFSVLLACVVGYDSDINSFLSLSRIIVFYPFFILGQMINKEDIVKISNNKTLKFASIMVLLIWLTICIDGLDSIYILRPLYTGKNPYIINPIFNKWGMLCRIFCYISTVGVSLAVLFLVPAKRCIYSKFGSRTLQVYFWHYLVFYISKYFNLVNIINHGITGKIIWILYAIVISLLLSVKLFGYPLNKVKKVCYQVKKT